MRFLVATDSVHTTAAACDYLGERLESDDSVAVVTVTGSDTRDGDDALNVANARLLGYAEVETERIESSGDPTNAILDAVAERSPDVVVIGKRAGVPDADAALGSTARRVVESVAVPVVAVPISV